MGGRERGLRRTSWSALRNWINRVAIYHDGEVYGRGGWGAVTSGAQFWACTDVREHLIDVKQTV